MKTAIALAALVALVTSPATAACYGGPASQTCNEAYRDGDTSAGVTTLRGYNAQHGVEGTEAITGSSNQARRKVGTRGGARITRSTPHDRPFFYVCTPYRGCT